MQMIPAVAPGHHAHDVGITDTFDFLNTDDTEDGVPADKLPTLDAALDWFVERGVIHGEGAENIRRRAVGHPEFADTELDRVYGTEAAYAGTSFLSPGDLGNLRYGSEKMNITSDATTPLGLGTFGFDDEGVPAQREAIVGEGLLRGFLSSRETAARIGAGVGGCMRADGWSRMPLVRMTTGSVVLGVRTGRNG